MKTQPYFEDIRVGEDIPLQVREPLSTRSLVKWAAAVRDFYEVHYDKDFARSIGLKDVIAHGPNKCALLGRLMTEWIGEAGRLHRLSARTRRAISPARPWSAAGGSRTSIPRTAGITWNARSGWRIRTASWPPRGPRRYRSPPGARTAPARAAANPRLTNAPDLF